MKKTTLTFAILLIAFSASAQDMWSYAIQPTFDITSLTGTESNGDGAGWYVSLFNSSMVELDSTTLGGYSEALSAYGIALFNTTPITEGQSVFYRLHDNALTGSASFYIDSLPASLQDLSPGFLPGDSNVTLSFSGQTWQAVPEPATALLFGIGGIGAFIVRRNKRKAQEEADA